MADLFEFAVKRNLRVVMARLRAKSMVALDRIARLFGGRAIRESHVSVYGVPMVSNFGDKTFRYCFYGTYGKHLSNYLDAIDRPFAFVDIGANQGLFTLIAGRNRQCCRLVAMEPVKRTFGYLEANVALNRLGDRAKLLNAALSDASGTAEIAIKPNHSGVASIAGGRSLDDWPTETIALMSIAELDQHLPDDREIVVKVDVEGHEPVVIAELLKSRHLARISGIFYEMDERWADAGRIADMLREAGFTRFTKYGIRRHYDMLAERQD
ncbi:MAG TPA: FkbM family methyltransferase [Sphingomonadaceae bacterium]|nr:FkbM family methyltransferase [Sphingomonadaceae bacterium]